VVASIVTVSITAMTKILRICGAPSQVA